MTKDRLIQYMENRKSPVTYEILAAYFAVDRKTVQSAIKKLERENRVQFTFGENGKKLWRLTGQEADPVAIPSVRVHRISDGEERTATKPRSKTPIQPQSWFSSVLEK
jgi:Mn-dependent DtxR family transcriptional regulator